MPTANVSLSQQQAAFIKQSIDGGRFQNASEVVRAGLHLLAQQAEQDRLKVQVLKKLAKQGFDEIDRGEVELITQGTLGRFMEAVSATRAPRRRK